MAIAKFVYVTVVLCLCPSCLNDVIIAYIKLMINWVHLAVSKFKIINNKWHGKPRWYISIKNFAGYFVCHSCKFAPGNEGVCVQTLKYTIHIFPLDIIAVSGSCPLSMVSYGQWIIFVCYFCSSNFTTLMFSITVPCITYTSYIHHDSPEEKQIKNNRKNNELRLWSSCESQQ